MTIFQGFFTWIWTLFLPCFPVFEQKLIYAPPRGGGGFGQKDLPENGMDMKIYP